MAERSTDSDGQHEKRTEADDLVEALVKNFAGRGLPGNSGSSDQRSVIKAFLDAVTGSGYEIRQSSVLPEVPADDFGDLTKRLAAQTTLRLRDLMSIWREVSGRESAGPPEFYAEVGERILKAGQPLIAHDILKGGLRHWSSNLRLLQLLALSLARSGASRRARSLLRALVDDGYQDEETLGLLARTNKDLWESADDPEERNALLKESHELYRQGYDRAVARRSPDGALYAGINAATTALLLGQRESATELARHVADICKRKLESICDYWALATLGECELVAGHLDQAQVHYREAARLAGHNYADIASTKRNAAMLLNCLGEKSVDLSKWFPVPRIVVFTGHLIDRPGMPVRFPPTLVKQVYEEIKKTLSEIGAGFGFSAAACGGDLLFLRALNDLGGESRIVLPLPAEQFIQASVTVSGHHDWKADFNHMIANASQVTVVNEFSQRARPEHFEYANHVMTGLAMLQSRALDTEVVPVTLWDERPARGPGGTATLVELWKNLGWEPRIINPLRLANDPLLVDGAPGYPGGDTTRFGSKSTTDIEVRAILFADVVGYSKLSEEEIPLFVHEFMGSISECVRKSGIAIETFNTWGDAIFFVFRNVTDAGITALRITEHVNSIDWQSRGFQSPMTLRTGLHVGPVFRVIDPVTKTSTHTGAHVSRAARIEPIAPPGEVYASEAFAAVAAADNVTEFQCEYVGVTPMAKGYGEFATYHVRGLGG